MSRRPPKPELPVVTLTPEQLEMRALHDGLELKLTELRERFNADVKAAKAEVPKCKDHIWILPGRVSWDWWGGSWHLSEPVHCAICGKYGGWYCPVNPTRACEYSEDDYMRDDCIHCHAPDERK